MSMTEDMFQELLSRDPRYTREAYGFVFDSLRYAQELEEQRNRSDDSGEEHHVTGAQVCEAARFLAVTRYGMLAGCILKRWGIRKTGDLGEIVYHLIDQGLMHRTDGDHREDFDDVFDLETELLDSFSFSSTRERRR